jgi:predicted 3-demethylubiquinone-9 3-methyltransferase (glyoxalase superfamily)
MPSITPSLWFDHNLEEAVAFYTSIFPNSHIEDLNRSTDAGPANPGRLRVHAARGHHARRRGRRGDPQDRG